MRALTRSNSRPHLSRPCNSSRSIRPRVTLVYTSPLALSSRVLQLLAFRPKNLAVEVSRVVVSKSLSHCHPGIQREFPTLINTVSSTVIFPRTSDASFPNGYVWITRLKQP
jgi:hypothetical protein